MKSLRLALTALCTAIVCLLYFYVFENIKLYFIYRCLTGTRDWYSCYSGKEVQFSTDFFGMKYEGNTKNGLDREVLIYGAYEKPILYFLRDVMQSVYSNEGVFLDVGANTGQHSMFMSRYAREVHAFEPYEPVLERFRKMIDLNHISNIMIHPVGLGNENITKPFHKPPEHNLGAGSFVEGFAPGNSFYGSLKIVVGDDVLAKADVNSVALIKMDIEGYEKFALQGLARTLRVSRPIVVFELTYDPKSTVGFKGQEDMRRAFPKDYEFLQLLEADLYTGLYRLNEIDPGAHFEVGGRYNFVACPSELKSRIPRRSPQ